MESSEKLTSCYLTRSLFQYGGAATNSPTLEEQLKLAREKIQAVQNNPGKGSGTPFLAADGMVTAMIISALFFGIFRMKSKSKNNEQKPEN